VPSTVFTFNLKFLIEMDKLEKYIQQNRTAFDVLVPPAEAWGEILRCVETNDDLEKFVLENKAYFNEATPSAQVGNSLWAALDQEKSDLERFLKNNKNDFDTATPPEIVWSKIEQNLPKTTAKKLFFAEYSQVLLRIAAGLALLITCFGAGMWCANSANRGGQEMAMSEISNEYAELEQFYQRDIAGKTQKLASFSSQNDIIEEDIAQMDKSMEELKIELANVPVNKREQIIRAMIENYKAKAKILEKVLEHIQPQQILEPSNDNKNHVIKNI
jgi:hypothetical protein